MESLECLEEVWRVNGKAGEVGQSLQVCLEWVHKLEHLTSRAASFCSSVQSTRN